MSKGASGRVVEEVESACRLSGTQSRDVQPARNAEDTLVKKKKGLGKKKKSTKYEKRQLVLRANKPILSSRTGVLSQNWDSPTNPLGLKKLSGKEQATLARTCK